ncbi:unnamed protein product [Didymodactylos carnosus]|uniref:G-protein coupled receptors family 1 profile domain-containing protein n=1 Tax=Didymodactylos carnosus TaxID=1234261 RepID=A0A815H1F1_9BILA|nr:unnamed protein product [Didymodactylos carnosus]CAF4215473.1 unnamed protein product [Didymodactylos carnosus]
MLPSLITIVANIVCVLRILNVKIRSSLCLLPSRRRIDETRRILTIITIECIVAIINCWFIDVLLSFIYCKRNLFIGFDCPLLVRKYYDLVIILDFLNSTTNILLYCLLSQTFRKELFQMLRTLFQCGCRIKQDLFVKEKQNLRCEYHFRTKRRKLIKKTIKKKSNETVSFSKQYYIEFKTKTSC